jgi:hypothetical protein
MQMISPQQPPKLEVQLYKKPKDIDALRQTHVPFSGAPHQHRSGPDRIMLVTDPYGGLTPYYEFAVKDIAFVEELPNMVTYDGEIITMVRIWVRKNSLGLHCSPFVVEDMQKIDGLGHS